MSTIRLEAAEQAEGLRRLYRITLARSAALAASYGLILVVTPSAIWLYLFGVIVAFIISGWLQYWLAVKDIGGWWRGYATVALDFAMLTYVLIHPAYGAPEEVHPAYFLRFDSFDFFYIILGGLAISLRPALVIWSGICVCVFWSVGLWWLIVIKGATYSFGENTPSVEDEIRNMSDPSFVDLGVQFQGMTVFLIVAIMLAIGVEASQRLFVRQVNQERRNANLSRYLPAESVEALADRDDPFSVEAETDAAILFADVVGFSGMAERATPKEVIELLRGVHAVVAEQVFAHHGVLDKFIGDGVMATFGAVTKGDRDAANAIDCAGAILGAVADFNEGRPGDPVRISLGVHYGPVIVGDVGSARRMELAVIGDAVNVAARLETATRGLQVGAAISEEAMIAAGRPAEPNLIGPLRVKGRAEPVVVFGLPR